MTKLSRVQPLGRHCGPALAFVIFSFLAIGAPRPAAAAGTDPTLAITEAQAFAASNGVVSVRVTGTFSFDDLLQFSFPAGLIVFQGERFARFGLDGEIATGTDPAVSNGITAGEIQSLLVAGGAAGPPASLSLVTTSRISVALPQDFSPGTASVLFYALLEGDVFVSNTVALTLP